jgi:hypothetical protein
MVDPKTRSVREDPQNVWDKGGERTTITSRKYAAGASQTGRWFAKFNQFLRIEERFKPNSPGVPPSAADVSCRPEVVGSAQSVWQIESGAVAAAHGF